MPHRLVPTQCLAAACAAQQHTLFYVQLSCRCGSLQGSLLCSTCQKRRATVRCAVAPRIDRHISRPAWWCCVRAAAASGYSLQSYQHIPSLGEKSKGHHDFEFKQMYSAHSLTSSSRPMTAMASMVSRKASPSSTSASVCTSLPVRYLKDDQPFCSLHREHTDPGEQIELPGT